MSIKQTKSVLLGVVILLTLLIFLQACEKSDSKGLVGTFIISVNETKTLSHQGKSVAVTASDFQDSRCPINANCIWQGYGSVKLTFKDNAKEQHITLCIGGCSIVAMPLLQTVTLNGATYKIKLYEITPYPTLDTTKTEVSKAKITLSE